MTNILNNKAALEALISKSISPVFGNIVNEAPIAPPAPVEPAPQPETPPPAATSDGNQMSVKKVASGEPGAAPESEELTKGSITLEMVVQKLNSIRSGRSFKDENIAAQMQKYFDDLNDNEKLALYAFLKGISQIVTGDVPGQTAIEPGDLNPALEVKSKDDGMKAVKHVKPNILKKITAPVQPAQSQENVAAPVAAPITPKKRQ